MASAQWIESAACRDSHPDELFAQSAQQNRVKAVCGGCAVRAEQGGFKVFSIKDPYWSRHHDDAVAGRHTCNEAPVDLDSSAAFGR